MTLRHTFHVSSGLIDLRKVFIKSVLQLLKLDEASLGLLLCTLLGDYFPLVLLSNLGLDTLGNELLSSALFRSMLCHRWFQVLIWKGIKLIGFCGRCIWSCEHIRIRILFQVLVNLDILLEIISVVSKRRTKFFAVDIGGLLLHLNSGSSFVRSLDVDVDSVIRVVGMSLIENVLVLKVILLGKVRVVLQIRRVFSLRGALFEWLVRHIV